jgi:SAM-dependent methyltransferase
MTQFPWQSDYRAKSQSYSTFSRLYSDTFLLKIMTKQLQARLNYFADAVALDLGCGTGLASKDIKPKISEVIFIDGSREMLRRGKRISKAYFHSIYVAIIDTEKRKDKGTADAIKDLLNYLLDNLGESIQTCKRKHMDFNMVEDPNLIWYCLDYFIIAYIDHCSCPSILTSI